MTFNRPRATIESMRAECLRRAREHRLGQLIVNCCRDAFSAEDEGLASALEGHPVRKDRFELPTEPRGRN